MRLINVLFLFSGFSGLSDFLSSFLSRFFFWSYVGQSISSVGCYLSILIRAPLRSPTGYLHCFHPQHVPVTHYTFLGIPYMSGLSVSVTIVRSLPSALVLFLTATYTISLHFLLHCMFMFTFSTSSSPSSTTLRKATPHSLAFISLHNPSSRKPTVRAHHFL